MFLTLEKINYIIDRLEESDKAISGAVARDQVMWSQTSIFAGLGMQNKALMKQGMDTYAQTMGTFKADIMSLVSSYQQGTMSQGAAMLKFKSIAGTHYQTLFKAGAMAMGNPFYSDPAIGLTKKDLSFIQKARNLEGKFFRKFLMDIKNPDFKPKIDFQKRAGFYADSGKAQFFNGMVNGAGENVEIHWVMSEAVEKHCSDCPVLASKVYTWQTLPTTPRAGDTACLFNCQCELEIIQKQASAPAGQSFNPTMPGSANQKAMEVPGRWAKVSNQAGEEMMGQVAKDMDDLFQQMNKARQMVTLTSGPEKLDWIATRRGINDLIIQRAKAGGYRVTPTVSVSQLKIALASAVEKGIGGYLTPSQYASGSEVVFLRGNFWTKGVIELRGATAYVKTAKGTSYLVNDQTDLVFGMKAPAPPVLVGEPVPVGPVAWKPTMTSAEATAWSKGSVVKTSLFHKTQPEYVDSILSGGFNVGEFGGAYGKGVYLSTSAEAGYGRATVEVVLNVRKVFKYTPALDAQIKEWWFKKWKVEWPNSGISLADAYAKDHGYDALVVVPEFGATGKLWYVVFDPKNITTIRHSAV